MTSLRIPNAALRFRPEELASASPAAASPEERAARSDSGGKGPGAAMKQFDQTAGSGAKRARKPGQTVYEIAANGLGDLKPVDIKTGITDGRYTQVDRRRPDGGRRPS